MKLLLSAILLLTALTGFSAAQESTAKPSRKIDSYNDKIPGSEAEQWHLEDFMKLLVADPGTKAYIIAYGGREDHPGKAQRYALRAKNYLIEVRGIEPQRIIAIDGGRREDFVVELWLVPNTGNLPLPTPTITVPDDRGDNLLYDDFDLGYDNFGSRTQDGSARLDGFATALKKEPNSWGCIVAYAEAGDDRMGMEWDAPGTALKIARAQRHYLIAKHHLASSRLSLIDGGYGGRIVELWIMRPEARFDKGPFLYPNRLKANRNGTLTISNRDSTGLCCKACLRGRTNPYVLKYAHRHRPKIMTRRNRTNRWTRAAKACFSTIMVRRRVL